MKLSHQLEHVLEDKLLGGREVKLFRTFLHRGQSSTEWFVRICVPYGFLSLEIKVFLDFKKSYLFASVFVFSSNGSAEIYKLQDARYGDQYLAHHNRVRPGKPSTTRCLFDQHFAPSVFY